MNKAERREKLEKYNKIVRRAVEEGIAVKSIMTAMMDVESADMKFDMRLDEWLKASQHDFVHDFLGIQRHINREAEYPATDFNGFVPRFAGR